ncbi:MAG: TetR/AcrR family transcriptional regulator [Sulfuricurvum sp.]|nr:TetR/AcrR family transcriptional regulator [Sulfuricurvum sp.]
MKNNVREQLIHTMFTSLYHEGYHASNLIDLLKSAGSSKGGLYHYFGSKKELALESIKSVLEAFIEHFWKHGLQMHNDPIVALESLLKELPHTTLLQNVPFEMRYGCPLNNLIHELSANDEDFSTLLISIMDLWHDAITDALQRGIDANIIRADVNVEQLAYFIIASIEGSLSIAKGNRDEETYHSNISILITYLNILKIVKKTTAPKKQPIHQSLFE